MYTTGLAMFVDKGIPYNDGPLKVGELTVTVTVDASPKHVKGLPLYLFLRFFNTYIFSYLNVTSKS